MVFRRRIVEAWPYLGMYLFYLIAGILVTLYPSQVILSAMQSGIAYMWSSFLIVGSLSSLYGILRDTWTGEIVGIPLVGSANAIFGIALIGYGTTTVADGIGCIFLGISFGLVGRWDDKRKVAKISQQERN